MLRSKWEISPYSYAYNFLLLLSSFTIIIFIFLMWTLNLIAFKQILSVACTEVLCIFGHQIECSNFLQLALGFSFLSLLTSRKVTLWTANLTYLRLWRGINGHPQSFAVPNNSTKELLHAPSQWCACSKCNCDCHRYCAEQKLQGCNWKSLVSIIRVLF